MQRSMPSARLRRRPLGRYRYVRFRWRVLFAAIDLVGETVFGAAGRIHALLAKLFRFRHTAGTEPDDPRTILLVQLDHLGDAILSTSMLGPLRERYPNASIEVLASTANREIFEAAAEVDRVHVSRVNRFARAGRFGWMFATLGRGIRLRNRKPDLAIDVRGDFPAALILWLCGARRRLGWDSAGGGFLLTDRAEFVHGRPEVESRRALWECLGSRPSVKDDLSAKDDLSKKNDLWWPVFRPSESARRRAAEILEPSQPRVVVHVGAGTSAKRWPVEHWRMLIGRLIDRHGAKVILVGGPDERGVAQSILGPDPSDKVNCCGQLNVDELGAVLADSDVFVGADSGPAHLAAAVGTPVAVLFSGTNRARQWQPRGRMVRVLWHVVACSPCHRTQCPLPDHPCMRHLTPNQVDAAVAELLGLTRPTWRNHRMASKENRP